MDGRCLNSVRSVSITVYGPEGLADSKGSVRKEILGRDDEIG